MQIPLYLIVIAIVLILIAILIFTALVFESFVYLISKGALDWGPLKVNNPIRTSAAEAAVDPHRTAASTVRRVGNEGRLVGPGSQTIPEPSLADLEPVGATGGGH